MILSNLGIFISLFTAILFFGPHSVSNFTEASAGTANLFEVSPRVPLADCGGMGNSGAILPKRRKRKQKMLHFPFPPDPTRHDPMHHGNPPLNVAIAAPQPNAEQGNQQQQQPPPAPPPPPPPNQASNCKHNCMVDHEYHVFFDKKWRPATDGFIQWRQGRPQCKCILSEYLVEFLNRRGISPLCGHNLVGWPGLFKSWFEWATSGCKHLVKTKQQLDHLVMTSRKPVPGIREN